MTTTGHARSFNWIWLIVGCLVVLLLCGAAYGIWNFVSGRIASANTAVYATQQAKIASSVSDRLTQIAESAPTSTLVPTKVPTLVSTATLMPATATLSLKVNPTATAIPATQAPAATQMPAPTEAPKAAEAPAAAASAVGECSLTDGTAQVQLKKAGTEWTLDPNNLQVVKGYNNTQPGHDISKLAGCDLWVEFESGTAKEHEIYVLRDDPSKPLAYLAADGLFHINQPKGGSAGVGPSLWNTGDLTTQKPSIALEFASEKRINQLRNGYNWPIVLHLPDGKNVTYGVDYKFGQFYSGCKDLKISPAPVNVAGTIVGDTYYASIGIEGCVTAVKIDGVWSFWHNARDGVLYTTVEAVLFKDGTSDADVQKWIDSQPK